jgi:hypothetical protein
MYQLNLYHTHNNATFAGILIERLFRAKFRASHNDSQHVPSRIPPFQIHHRSANRPLDVNTNVRACEQATYRVQFSSMAPDAATLNGTPTTPALQTPQKPSVTPNVLEVVFGSLLIQPWYPSFYPEELVGRKVDRLYVCQWCFKYSKELIGFLGHLVSSTHQEARAWLTRRRKHVPCATPHHPASTSTQKTATRSTKSMARSTSSMHRTSRSSPNCSSTPNPSSTT